MKRTIRRRPGSPPGESAAAPTVDLTSLVDVTFQLLVFLLVVNDLSARVQEDVTLPDARHATEIQPQDDVVTVNVLAPAGDGAPRIRIGGRELAERELGDALGVIADLHRPPAEPTQPSRATVLIRADRGAPWEHVQGVLRACVRADVLITRIQFATADPTSPHRQEQLR